MQQTVDDDGDELRSASVTFQPFGEVVHSADEVAASPVLGGESTLKVPVMGYDREPAAGDIDAALEVTHSSPNDIDAHALTAALGETLVAVIDGEERTVIATNANFDASQPPSRENPPVAVGDLVPSEIGVPLKLIDHPTGGPLFENPAGEHVQHDDYGFLIVE